MWTFTYQSVIFNKLKSNGLYEISDTQFVTLAWILIIASSERYLLTDTYNGRLNHKKTILTIMQLSFF